ncbi:Methyltransferase type 11 [Sulfitobacter guttiformis KCTC 32187]|uniref:Methyltransferase family protein n=2 Tax=Sulfitobacter guttiformis TaxID=74349 RepID=A0A420DTY8_9RHOB|nr:Methyltransferase type 11 [Sulfitobacter guttiformis KCTC 32187]RKE97577.1 methyltransferase family protein [Sulfitobacter guttiformis]
MGFSAAWLGLREPADLAARDPSLLEAAGACVPEGGLVLDLGCGTGSTARAFASIGFSDLRWRFFDNDPALLAEAARNIPQAEMALGNLVDIDVLPLEGVSLVTASALLDLMPQCWVEALADKLWQAGIPFYAALNYDGRMGWTPELPLDGAVTKYFNRHQRTDKGIGIALGPKAGAEAALALRSRGFNVTFADSPWRLGAAQATLHAELLGGIGSAAAEAGLNDAAEWALARCAAVEKSEGMIGHTDLLAIVPARASA